MSGEIQWEVERILQRGIRNGETIYLVKWKGFPESEATWEPISNLEHCTKCIQEFQNTFKQCFSGKKQGKKRGRSRRLNLQAIQEEEGPSKKVCIQKIKNQENTPQGQQNEDDTDLPPPEKKAKQKQTQEEKPQMEDKQCEIETLEIFSPFYLPPQTQKNEVKEQTNIRETKRMKKSAKRIVQRMESDNEANQFPSKKVKVQTYESRNVRKVNQSPLNKQKEKELQQQHQDEKHIDFKNLEQKPQLLEQRESKERSQQQITLKDVSQLKNISYKVIGDNQECEVDKANNINQSKQPQNLQSLFINQKRNQRITISQLLHERQINCDSLLKKQTAFFLHSCLGQKRNNISTKLALVDLTHFPELLEQNGFLKPIKQPQLNMKDFDALIRLRSGWLAVGKVQGIASIVDVRNLSLSAWTSLLQKYK